MTEQRFIITENMMDSLYGSDNAKNDQHAKHLLASRKLLAEIVKKVVPEFQDASIDDIAEKYIEGTPLVGSIPVAPGLTNAVPSKISDGRNEDGAPKEGYIHLRHPLPRPRTGNRRPHDPHYQRGSPAQPERIDPGVPSDEKGRLLCMPPYFITERAGI